MKKIVLLNGGVRKTGSSSMFVTELKDIMEAKGNKVTILHIIDKWDGKLSKEELVAAIQESDLIGISCNDYVNTMPYSTIACFEELLEVEKEIFKGREIFVIAHGGMPYLDVHEHIVRVVENFAERKEMKFLGGLICGLTPVINGKPLDEGNFISKRIKKAFIQLCDEVLACKVISSATQKMIISKIPTLLAYPAAAIITRGVVKDRKAHGIDIKKIYPDVKF